MKKKRIVYVHAWEYVNPGPDAGGGGFYWYPKKADAVKAFEIGNGIAQLDDTADFYFEVEVPAGMKRPAVTELIDESLHEHCAKAKDRRVGANVLHYWRKNKFKMGGAKRPARS